MSIAASASQFIDIFTRFVGTKPEDFLTSGPTFSEFDGPNVTETIAALHFLRANYEPLIASGEIHLVTRTALGTLVGQVQNTNNTYTNLLSSRDQGSFQNFAMALDGFAHHTRMFGVPYLATGGAQLEAQRQAISNEIGTLTKNNAEVEALKADVRTLITPAIAGSLSEAFRQRRDSLYKGRLIWMVACLALGTFATFSTFDFVHTVSAAIAPQKTAAAPDSSINIWIVIAIRTVALLPLFAAFGFSFSQYKKERDFEEEYAHNDLPPFPLPINFPEARSLQSYLMGS